MYYKDIIVLEKQMVRRPKNQQKVCRMSACSKIISALPPGRIFFQFQRYMYRRVEHNYNDDKKTNDMGQ